MWVLYFFFRIVLAILGSFNLHMNIRISWSIFCKAANWKFDADWVESVYQFGEHFHLNHIKIWSMMSSHIFRFNFFRQCFVFSDYKSYATSVKFMPKYVILLDAIINGIVFIFEMFTKSLQNTIGSCILIYHTSLLIY